MQRWELRQKVANLAVEHLSRHCSEALDLIQVLGITAWLGQLTLSLPGKSLLSRGMPSRLPMGRLERMDRMQWLSQIRRKEACSPLGCFTSYAVENILGQTDAFLCPGTSCGSNISLWVSSQFIVTESHLVCIDYYASSCLLYSLASRSLIVHNSLACQATSTRQRAVTESLGGKPCLGEECFVKLVNAYGDDACMDMNEKS